jgi:flagellar motility protein MotE (MotC chaperone)
MNLNIPTPRLLPITMLAMAVLLGTKSVALVSAAIAASAADAPAVPSTSQGTMPPEAPKKENSPDGTKAAPNGGSQKTADTRPDDPKHEALSAPHETEPGGSRPPVDPPISESERTLLLDLRKRSLELDARDASLVARESVLAAAETRLARRVEELGVLQKRLEALEAARRAHDEANWQGLVKLYEAMKPREAAAIFNDLDMTVLLPVLDRMKESKAALVMAAMLPERARQATAELAQMRARANAVPAAEPSSLPAAASSVTPPPAKPTGGG